MMTAIKPTTTARNFLTVKSTNKKGREGREGGREKEERE